MGRKRKAEPKKTKTDRHGIRERLLRAGEALFSERGIHRSQVSQVAEHASVSVGAFYRYFRDKDELYRELLRTRFDAYLDEIRSLTDDVDTTSLASRLDLLRAVFRRSFEFHLRDPQTFLLWYRHGHGVSEAMSELVDQLTGEAEALIGEILDRTATVGGTLTADQRLALAASLLGMTNSMTHRLIKSDAPAVEDAVDMCSRLAAAGLLGFAPPQVRAAMLAAYEATR